MPPCDRFKETGSIVMILRLRRRNDAKIAMAQQRSQLRLADAAISWSLREGF
jgi:hypothetical protein